MEALYTLNSPPVASFNSARTRTPQDLKRKATEVSTPSEILSDGPQRLLNGLGNPEQTSWIFGPEPQTPKL